MVNFWNWRIGKKFQSLSMNLKQVKSILKARTIKELLLLTEAKLKDLEATGAPRIMLYGCDHGSKVEGMQSSSVAAISMPCSALVPPAFIDYVLRKNLAEGVMISGCCEGDCFYRLGNDWMDERFSMERMPVLRERVPRE